MHRLTDAMHTAGRMYRHTEKLSSKVPYLELPNPAKMCCLF